MAKRAKKRRRRASLRYEDIAAAFYQEVVVPRRVLIDSGYDLDHLRRHFRGRAITAIDEASIREYALTRQDQGAPDATINGEIRTLDRVLQFAVQNGTLRRVPTVEFLPEPLPAWFGAPNPLSRRVDPVEWYLSHKQPEDWPAVTTTPAKKRGKAQVDWKAHYKAHPLSSGLSPARRAQMLGVHRTTVLRHLPAE